MRIWARVAGGVICELVETDRPIEGLFHSDLCWVDVTQQTAVVAGWLWDGERAVAHEPPFEMDDAASLNG